MEETNETGPAITSPSLLALKKYVDTVCAHCPNSMWFGSEKEIKCFCRVMHVVTWSDNEKNMISFCDGLFPED